MGQIKICTSIVSIKKFGSPPAATYTGVGARSAPFLRLVRETSDAKNIWLTVSSALLLVRSVTERLTQSSFGVHSSRYYVEREAEKV